jgi:hypothetical protein
MGTDRDTIVASDSQIALTWAAARHETALTLGAWGCDGFRRKSAACPHENRGDDRPGVR